MGDIGEEWWRMHWVNWARSGQRSGSVTRAAAAEDGRRGGWGADSVYIVCANIDRRQPMGGGERWWYQPKQYVCSAHSARLCRCVSPKAAFCVGVCRWSFWKD